MRKGVVLVMGRGYADDSETGIARIAQDHASWNEVINNAIVKDTLRRFADNSPVFAAGILFQSGIAVGKHRERQSRKDKAQKDNRRSYLNGVGDGYNLAFQTMRRALEEITAAPEDEDLDLEAVYNRIFEETDLRKLPGLCGLHTPTTNNGRAAKE